MTLNSLRGIALNGMGGGIDTGNNTVLYGGVINNYSFGVGEPANFSKLGNGTLELTGVNTYFGQMDITAGTLNINSDSALGFTTNGVTFNGSGTLQFAIGYSGTSLSASRNLTVASGNSGAVDTNGNSLITFDGTLANAGTFSKVGVGTFELDAAPALGNGSTLAAQRRRFAVELRQRRHHRQRRYGDGLQRGDAGTGRLGLAIEPGGEHRQQ